MSPLRVTIAVVAALLALGLDVLLLSTQYGLAEMYGGGYGTTLLLFAILPLSAGLAAALLAGSGRWTMVALGVFTVVTLAGVPAAAALGGRAQQARFEQEDAAFGCSGANAESPVPEGVDSAFHAMSHPAPYWLYGPVSGSPGGCTAAIDGPAEESFAAWRTSLLETGWEVERDDSEVVVARRGVRLTLFVDSGLSMLNASTGDADACEDGRGTTYADGRVGPC